MITIYTSPSCSSCKKVKQWFNEQNIPFKEKNIFCGVLNANELKDILAKSENGTDDIISRRSNVFKSGNYDIDAMSISELIDFIKNNPSVLKRPIIVDDRRIQVGYNDEEIRSFIPKARRYLADLCPNGCEDCENKDFMKYIESIKNASK